MSVLVIGAGGHAKVVIATLQAQGRNVTGVVDDDATLHDSTLLGCPVLGGTDRLAAHDGEEVWQPALHQREDARAHACVESAHHRVVGAWQRRSGEVRSGGVRTEGRGGGVK